MTFRVERSSNFQIVKMPSLSKTFLGYRNFKAVIPIPFCKKNNRLTESYAKNLLTESLCSTMNVHSSKP